MKTKAIMEILSEVGITEKDCESYEKSYYSELVEHIRKFMTHFERNPNYINSLDISGSDTIKLMKKELEHYWGLKCKNLESQCEHNEKTIEKLIGEGWMLERKLKELQNES